MNLANGHRFEIWNGYEEYPSPELIAGSLRASQGRLVAIPPEGFAGLALPFYLALGYRGLFVVNELALLGIVALTWDLGRRLMGGRVGFVAVAILLGATFVWDYAHAAWPHATAGLVVLAAFWATWRALDTPSSVRWSLAAGLISGLGLGIRLDTLFAWPGLLLPHLFLRPPQWRNAAGFLAGAVPGLALLTWINLVKFGDPTPFTYGGAGTSGTAGLRPYLPITAVGVVVLFLCWVLTRRRVLEALAGRPWRAIGIAASVAIAVLALTVARELLLRLGGGVFQLVVDLRPRDLSLAEPALSRTEGGALVYVGAVKKSLLQSMPYLPIVSLPLLTALRGSRRRAMVMLLAIPVSFVLAYSWFAWHGGLSLNLRYFVPVLPFIALLGAIAWEQLSARGTKTGRAALIGGVAAAALFLVLVPAITGPPAAQEHALLDVPLIIAVSLVVCGAAALLGRRTGAAHVLLDTVTSLTAAGLTWASLVTFFNDVPRARELRAANLDVAQWVAPYVPPDSLLFAHYPDPFFALKEIDRLRLAIPTRDDFATFRPLLEHHLGAGRPVFAAFPPRLWQQLASSGHLDGLQAHFVAPESWLARLEHAGPSEPAPPAP
ncbi:MAG TPA: glycosyltransferase family 39 protein [Thermoanaerobaculia bacterium]|nr:glycosyltransferase family 39 protein [Thermoanaerobaculia bacterium]